MKDYREVLKSFESIAGPIKPHAEVLRRYAENLKEWDELLVKVFYDTLFSYGTSASIFREGERTEREVALKMWYRRVVSGEWDESFWEWQFRKVGFAHVIRGIPNEFILSAMSLLQRTFLEKALQEFPVEEAVRVYTAFKHITDAVATLMAAGYMYCYLEALSESTGMPPALIERHAVLLARRIYEEI